MEQLVVELLRYFAILLVGIVGKLVWDKMRSMSDDIKKLREDQNEIRTNYLARFEDVKDSIHDSSKEIIANVNALRFTIAENYVRRRDCFALHQIETRDHATGLVTESEQK